MYIHNYFVQMKVLGTFAKETISDSNLHTYINSRQSPFVKRSFIPYLGLSLQNTLPPKVLMIRLCSSSIKFAQHFNVSTNVWPLGSPKNIFLIITITVGVAIGSWPWRTLEPFITDCKIIKCCHIMGTLQEAMRSTLHSPAIFTLI